jgi:hypothetical protein
MVDQKIRHCTNKECGKEYYLKSNLHIFKDTSRICYFEQTVKGELKNGEISGIRNEGDECKYCLPKRELTHLEAYTHWRNHLDKKQERKMKNLSQPEILGMPEGPWNEDPLKPICPDGPGTEIRRDIPRDGP